MAEQIVVEETRSISRLRHQESFGAYELLAFVCNEELYAVELESVHEIVIPPPLTPVPRAPHAVLGICSVRGQLVTVLSLRAILNLPSIYHDRKNRILLAQLGSDELIGLLVDEVHHVVRLKEDQVEPKSQSLGGESTEGVVAIGRPDKDVLIVILDLITVLEKGCR